MTGGLRYCTQTNPNPFRSKSRNRMIPFGCGGLQPSERTPHMQTLSVSDRRVNSGFVSGDS